MWRRVSEVKGREQRPPCPEVADVLVGEEVAAQKGTEWLWSPLGVGAGHRRLTESLPFQGPSSGLSGVSPPASASGKKGAALVTALAGSK